MKRTGAIYAYSYLKYYLEGLVDIEDLLKHSISMTNFILILLLSVSSALAGKGDLKYELFLEAKRNQRSFNYTEARVRLFNKIYLEQDEKGYYIQGVYCQKKHYPFGGSAPRNRLPNHEVFNTEHTWPQSKFSPHFQSEIQKTDLHHLFPTYSLINAERGNLPFAEVNSGSHLSCDASHRGSPTRGGRGSYFEPPDSHKGNVARAMFYFSIRYQSAIDSVQESYLRLWHKEDPIDQSEKVRHERIIELQGNRNPFIDAPHLVDQIQDF